MCQISVVTSVYNCEKYIGETIESILNQTFREWEYIIIDNASTDASAKIIESYARKDSRIRFYRNRENIGISANLNKGLDLACGKYVARTDADDLSFPVRLEKQFQYMEEHPDIALLGCNCDILDHGNAVNSSNLVYNNQNEIRFILPFANIMAASSFFVRRDFIKKNNIIYRSYIYAEDYGFLLDILRFGAIYSLPESMIAYRIYPEQMTQTIRQEIQEKERIDIQMAFLDVVPFEWRDFFLMAFAGEISSTSDMKKVEYAIIQYAMDCGMGINKDDLTKHKFVQYAYRCVYDWQIGNLKLLFAYMRSPLRIPFWFMKKRGIALIMQCILRTTRSSMMEMIRGFSKCHKIFTTGFGV